MIGLARHTVHCIMHSGFYAKRPFARVLGLRSKVSVTTVRLSSFFFMGKLICRFAVKNLVEDKEGAQHSTAVHDVAQKKKDSTQQVSI